MKEAATDLNVDFEGIVDINIICGGMRLQKSNHCVEKCTETIEERFRSWKIYWRTLTLMSRCFTCAKKRVGK